MAVGSLNFMVLLNEDVERVQLRTRNALLDARDRSRSRDHAGADLPDERLACPACRRAFDFGRCCPGCELELVGLSFVESAGDPAKLEASPIAQIGMGILGVGLSALAVFSGFSLLLWSAIFDTFLYWLAATGADPSVLEVVFCVLATVPFFAPCLLFFVPARKPRLSVLDDAPSRA